MNSKWHASISFAKSAVRIVGGSAALILDEWAILAGCLIAAELLGIAEELGDKR